MKKHIVAIVLTALTISDVVFAEGKVDLSTDKKLIAKIEELNQRINDLEQPSEPIPAPAAKADWTDIISIKGDFRVQYENFRKDSKTSKNRFRGRARVGVYADVNEQVQTGVRIATGSDQSPTSTNQDLDEFSNKKAIWLDLAYMSYTPDYLGGSELLLGKIRQPWLQVSDLMYDKDLNPEGAHLRYEKEFGKTTLITGLGYFIWQEGVDKNAAADITMGTGQLAIQSKLSDTIQLTLGGTAYMYHNIEGAEIATDDNGKYLPKGNSWTTTDGTNRFWETGFEVLEGFAKLDLKNKIAPIRVYADYSYNQAADNENIAWMIGVGTKYKKLSLDYNYRDIEADAVVGLIADASFGGTDRRGHKIKLSYELLKNWSTVVSFYAKQDSADTPEELLQIDLIAKF